MGRCMTCALWMTTNRDPDLLAYCGKLRTMNGKTGHIMTRRGDGCRDWIAIRDALNPGEINDKFKRSPRNERREGYERRLARIGCADLVRTEGKGA